MGLKEHDLQLYNTGVTQARWMRSFVRSKITLSWVWNIMSVHFLLCRKSLLKEISQLQQIENIQSVYTFMSAAHCLSLLENVVDSSSNLWVSSSYHYIFIHLLPIHVLKISDVFLGLGVIAHSSQPQWIYFIQNLSMWNQCSSSRWRSPSWPTKIAMVTSHWRLFWNPMLSWPPSQADTRWTSN